MDESDRAVGIDRRQGVLDGLREKGVADVLTFAGDYSYQSGQHMTALALEQGPVDAIICATDRLAFGGLPGLDERGLRIPEDVSVAGFGGYDEGELLKPRLTTLKFDSYALGYLGAETLLENGSGGTGTEKADRRLPDDPGGKCKHESLGRFLRRREKREISRNAEIRRTLQRIKACHEQNAQKTAGFFYA